MGVNTLTVDSGFLRVFFIWLLWGFFWFEVFSPILLQYYLRVVYKFHGGVVST